MRLAVFGDVHGCLDELTELLNKPEIKECDEVFSLGDLTDKGPYSNECVELCADRNVTLINSNHDDKYIQFIKKNRQLNTIKNDERRQIYGSLSKKSKHYLLTAKPFIRLQDKAVLVHGGIGPEHDLDKFDGKVYNDILRLRYVDKDALTKVSTIHNDDGSWGPEHPNVLKFQQVYDRRYGVIVHGHSVESTTKPVIWKKGLDFTLPDNKCFLSDIDIVSLDTGCVYGNYLSCMLIDGDKVAFIQIKAKKVYCKK